MLENVAAVGEEGRRREQARDGSNRVVTGRGLGRAVGRLDPDLEAWAEGPEGGPERLVRQGRGGHGMPEGQGKAQRHREKARSAADDDIFALGEVDAVVRGSLPDPRRNRPRQRNERKELVEKSRTWGNEYS